MLDELQRYILFASVVVFITGMGLLFYHMVFGLNVLESGMVSSPVHWIVLGVGLYFVFMFHNLRGRGLL